MQIRVKGIKKVRSKGRVYYYHRTSKTRILSLPGTSEFLQEITKLDRNRPTKPEEEKGTLRALISRYIESPEFTRRRARTRKDYRRVLDYFAPLSAMPLDAFNDSAFLIDLRDKAYAQHKWRFANYVIQVSRLLLSFGVPRGFTKTNAAMSVPLMQREATERANRPWKDKEREVVLKRAPEQLRAPIALAMFAGQRQQDAVAFPRRGYKGRAVDWNALKNGREMWLPAHPRLRQILDAIPKTATILCLTSRGKPWTQAGFRASFFKLIRQLEEEGKVEPGLTFHGLRHTLGDALAEAGCDTRTIAAVLGITEKMAEHYSKGADQRRRAAEGIQRLIKSKRMARRK